MKPLKHSCAAEGCTRLAVGIAAYCCDPCYYTGGVNPDPKHGEECNALAASTDPRLGWCAQQVVDVLAGAITSAASYAAHNPSTAQAVMDAVLDLLDDSESAYLQQLLQRAAERFATRDGAA